jgi:hypothetical protein
MDIGKTKLVLNTLDSVELERAKIVAIIEAKYKQKLIDKRTTQTNNKTRK